jgi:AcrR family transcriptional regulator
MEATKRRYSSPRQQERQQRILEMARQEIAANGYDGLTMRGLAATAGVALKTLYNLYSSKDELLLAAVGDLLEGLVNRSGVRQPEAGIPALLAYVELTGAEIQAAPVYAHAMSHALFQASAEHHLVDVLIADTAAIARESLRVAEQQGELLPDTDIDEIATTLVAGQWGHVMLWTKGLLTLDALPRLMRQCEVALLASVTRGERRDWLLEEAR